MKSVLSAGVAFGLMITAAQAEIKIGVVVPVTGPNAAFGAQIGPARSRPSPT